MFFAEKKGLSGGLLMLLLEHSECDKYSELLVPQYFPQPDAPQRIRQTAFLSRT